MVKVVRFSCHLRDGFAVLGLSYVGKQFNKQKLTEALTSGEFYKYISD